MQRTIDGYLRYAEHNQAAYRTIVSGGVGFDTQVQAIRDGVRAAIVATLAEGAYGRSDIPPIARIALLGWLCSVEGPPSNGSSAARSSPGTILRDLLVRTLRHSLRHHRGVRPRVPRARAGPPRGLRPRRPGRRPGGGSWPSAPGLPFAAS